MRELVLKPVHQELEEALSAQVFGGDATAQGIKARIAESPIAFSLKATLEAAKIEIPPQIDLYKRYGIWVVPVRIGVMRESGLAEVTSVGCEVEFADLGGTLCVIELLPGPAFIRHGGVEGQFVCEGALQASGAVAPLAGIQHGAAAFEVKSRVAHNAGLSLGVAGEAKAELSFRFVVATPYVHAVGVGSKRVQWRLDRNTEPLFGRDLQFFAVVAMPKNRRELGLRARVSLTARTAFFPTRRESEWTDLRCELQG